jgi:dTDP-glucose 4,6-dehydratase
MKVLITGGAGFIGSNFLRNMLAGNLSQVSKVTVLDKLTYAGTTTNFHGIPKDDFEFVKGDICDESIAARLIGTHDLIINFAAESHVDRSINGSKEFVETNILGVQNLLDAFKKKASGTFVQVSTDEVYGSVLNGSSTETDQLMPNSPYSASKASADLLARSYFQTYNLDIRITRCSNNYGPNQFPEKLIPLFVTNLMEGKKVPVYGDGSNVRDWLHVNDHCQGIDLVMKSGTPGEIYNIGGGEELTNLDITKKIIQTLGGDESSIQYVEDRKGHDFRYSIDCKKISTELGYTPKVSFVKGLKDTITWYQENTKWWSPLKHPDKENIDV